MKPSQVANSLRHIASKIDNSTNPKRELVARDLKRLVTAMGTLTGQEKAILTQFFMQGLEMLEVAGVEGYSEKLFTPGEDFETMTKSVKNTVVKAAALIGINV